MIEEFVIGQGIVLYCLYLCPEVGGALVAYSTIKGEIHTGIFLYDAYDDLAWRILT